MESIQFVQITREQLKETISEEIKTHFDDLKKNLQPKEPSEYLTRKETADLLKVNLSTLWHWQKKNLLKPVSIGARIYYKRSDIDNAIVQIKN